MPTHTPPPHPYFQEYVNYTVERIRAMGAAPKIFDQAQYAPAAAPPAPASASDTARGLKRELDDAADDDKKDAEDGPPGSKRVKV